MPKAARKSPGVGHNSGPIDQSAVRRAVAQTVLMDAEFDKLRERRKTMRKGFEQKGIPLSELDRLVKMKDEAPSEIIRMFKNLAGVFGAFFSDLNEQFDIFAPKANPPEERAAYRHAGMMQALKGEDMTAPPGLAGDGLQQFLEGYNEARPLYEEAKLEFFAEALSNAKDGIVTDGTGGKLKLKSNVATQAATDFAQDNQPDWSGYPLELAEWNDTQRAEFAKWFATVPEGATITMEHAGAQAAFREALAAHFEAPESELESQRARKALKERQAAEIPDPKEVDDAAAKVKRSGFLDRSKAKVAEPAAQ